MSPTVLSDPVPSDPVLSDPVPSGPVPSDLDPSIVWQALEQAPDAMVICDAAGLIRYANHVAETLFGHPRSVLIGQTVEILVPVRLQGTHHLNRERYLAHPATRPMGSGLQLTAQHRDGHEVPVEISLSPLAGADEPYVVAVIRDVTEQREAQRATRETLALLDNTHDGTYVFNARDHRFTYVNRGACRQVGRSRQELLGMTLTDLAPGLEPDAFERLLAPLRSGTSQLVTIDTQLAAAEGRVFPVEGSIQLVQSETGVPTFVVVLRDVSERQQLLDQIAAQRDHLMRVVEALQDGLLEVDLVSGDLVHANDRFYEMVGAPRGTAPVGDPMAPWMSEEDAEELRGKVLASGSSRCEMMLRHASGREFPVSVSASQVRSTPGRATFVSVFHDLTDDRAAAAALAAATSRLAIAEERDRIARDLHDTVIQRLFATGLTLQAASGRTERADVDKRIELAVVGIDDAIRDLRTSIFTLRRPVDSMGVADSVRVTAEEARRMLDCPLLVDLSPSVDAHVPSSLRDELVAVVRETLMNVVKHASARSVGLALDVEDGQVVVRIDDDGVGFAQDSVAGGHGLRNLHDRAARLGGTCHVRSGIGAGTHIVWSVPLSQ